MSIPGNTDLESRLHAEIAMPERSACDDLRHNLSKENSLVLESLNGTLRYQRDFEYARTWKRLFEYSLTLFGASCVCGSFTYVSDFKRYSVPRQALDLLSAAKTVVFGSDLHV